MKQIDTVILLANVLLHKRYVKNSELKDIKNFIEDKDPEFYVDITRDGVDGCVHDCPGMFKYGLRKIIRNKMKYFDEGFIELFFNRRLKEDVRVEFKSMINEYFNK